MTVVVEHLFERVFRELRVYQVVMQHSLVEVSVAVEPLGTPFNECQNKQVRATKLDLEMNIKAQLDPSQTIWPWLIECAAHALLFRRISGDDGGTALRKPKKHVFFCPQQFCIVFSFLEGSFLGVFYSQVDRFLSSKGGFEPPHGPGLVPGNA